MEFLNFLHIQSWEGLVQGEMHQCFKNIYFFNLILNGNIYFWAYILIFNFSLQWNSPVCRINPLGHFFFFFPQLAVETVCLSLCVRRLITPSSSCSLCLSSCHSSPSSHLSSLENTSHRHLSFAPVTPRSPLSLLSQIPLNLHLTPSA